MAKLDWERRGCNQEAAIDAAEERERLSILAFELRRGLFFERFGYYPKYSPPRNERRSPTDLCEWLAENEPKVYPIGKSGVKK